MSSLDEKILTFMVRRRWYTVREIADGLDINANTTDTRMKCLLSDELVRKEARWTEGKIEPLVYYRKIWA